MERVDNEKSMLVVSRNYRSQICWLLTFLDRWCELGILQCTLARSNNVSDFLNNFSELSECWYYSCSTRYLTVNHTPLRTKRQGTTTTVEGYQKSAFGMMDKPTDIGTVIVIMQGLGEEKTWRIDFSSRYDMTKRHNKKRCWRKRGRFLDFYIRLSDGLGGSRARDSKS